MMKKYGIGALLIAVIGVGVYFFMRRENPEQAVPKVEVNELPYLTFSMLDGQRLSAHDLPGKTILILFNTECDHCHNEAKEIGEHLQAFQNYNLFFLASDSVHQIRQFSTDHNLVAQPNISFGRVEVEAVITTFGPIAAPSVYIYSAEKKLVKYFNGETRVEEIINYL